MASVDSPIWLLYPLYLRGGNGTCLVYQNALEAAGGPRPKLVSLYIPVSPADENEFGSRKDRDAATSSIEGIETLLESTCDGLWVGQLREVGGVTACFYCRTSPSQETLQQVLALCDPSSSIEVTEDVGWLFYRERLAPTPIALAWSQNSMVEHALRSSGDLLTAPRVVTHAAHFPSLEAARAYCAELEAEGFITTKPEGRRPKLFQAKRWWVEATRDDLPTADALTPITIDLKQRAESHGGEYDGWEAVLVTVKPAT